MRTRTEALRALLAAADDGDSDAAEMILESLPALLDDAEEAERLRAVVSAETEQMYAEGQAGDRCGQDYAAGMKRVLDADGAVARVVEVARRLNLALDAYRSVLSSPGKARETIELMAAQESLRAALAEADKGSK